MTEKKPLALHLADALENLEATGWGGDCFSLTEHSEQQAQQAAVEMRRLYQEHEEDQGVIAVWRGRTQRAEAQRDQLQEENERLRLIVPEVLEDLNDKLCEENERLTAQRDQLLEALKLALSSHGVMLTSYPPQDAWKFYGVEEKARAAIKAVEKGK